MRAAKFGQDVASMEVQYSQTERTSLRDDETASITSMEFIARAIGSEEYGVDIQKVQEPRG